MTKDFKLVLSPLAGVTDKSFRSICRDNGVDYSYTEMVSAKGLLYSDRKTKELLDTYEGEESGIQIFGSDPEIISKVIKERINHLNFSSIDLNMGCPAPKIFKNGEGSALMRSPELVKRIVFAMREATDLPISVKFRLGVDGDHINYLEIGKICQDYGADKVTLHARTREQMYGGKADWDAIKNLKESLRIKVVGNGDVFSPEDAIKMMDYTGVDEIAIGRGSMGNPFIFRQIKDFAKKGTYDKVSINKVIDTILEHYRRLLINKPERISINEMRKHIAWYIKGFRGSNIVKNKINTISNAVDVFKVLEEYKLNLEQDYGK